MRSFIESDLSDNTESYYSTLSQFRHCYKVAFTKDRFVVDNNYYVSIYEWMNESAMILGAYENQLRAGLV